MSAVWRAAVLILVIFINLGSAHGAEKIVGQEKVSELRGWSDSYLFQIGVSSGAMTSLVAFGVTCEQIFTVAEMQAYLAFTAPPEFTVQQAVSQFFQSRKCVFPKVDDAKLRTEAWGEGFKSAIDTASELLLQIRENENIGELEAYVNNAQTDKAGSFDKVCGLIAGARLAELTRKKSGTPVIERPKIQKR
jgi:hypothetical protein